LLYYTLARDPRTALFLRWGLPVRAWSVGADGPQRRLFVSAGGGSLWAAAHRQR
jgi:hypothetical protein